ncbi:aminoacyl tRNA synthase complex-interacting multifunctional protein 1 [Octopus bimaculoides]|uniref:tRNA-binding domain-containing protein n=1 Tax=Octopus bimaculoides TaxID=37653 RepID=A0A0L8GH17_OCTBM|nr:aminoacyl tRNA synthase complex-interacting multifunctional protein 1 [Octopus bimaculoides]|eukprot:XP_014781138.1 PREDICTED: aminoacyl tRNA synthase complex-interacting multifunctional protein 1-like [Octopus bimaculoides]
MASESAIQHLSQRATLAEEILAKLKHQLEDVKRTAMKNIVKKEEQQIRRENERLKVEVNEYKKKLMLAEIGNGIRQIPIPNKRNLDQITTDQRVSPTKEVEVKKVKAGPKPADSVNPDKTSEVDVSKLYIRVGFVKSAQKHPDADKMYVEEVDMGEEKPRTVVSGLVGAVPLSEIEGHLCVFLSNLKPAKLRGVLSEGMILGANNGEKVELLRPPPGSVPGDRVVCAKYPGEPERVITSKNKIWDLVKADVKTNNSCVATYKGEPLIIEGKGQVTVPSVGDSQIC